MFQFETLPNGFSGRKYPGHFVHLIALIYVSFSVASSHLSQVQRKSLKSQNYISIRCLGNSLPCCRLNSPSLQKSSRGCLCNRYWHCLPHLHRTLIWLWYSYQSWNTCKIILGIKHCHSLESICTCDQLEYNCVQPYMPNYRHPAQLHMLKVMESQKNWCPVWCRCQIQAPMERKFHGSLYWKEIITFA